MRWDRHQHNVMKSHVFAADSKSITFIPAAHETVSKLLSGHFKEDKTRLSSDATILMSEMLKVLVQVAVVSRPGPARPGGPWPVGVLRRLPAPADRRFNACLGRALDADPRVLDAGPRGVNAERSASGSRLRSSRAPGEQQEPQRPAALKRHTAKADANSAEKFPIKHITTLTMKR
ncbi:unnamed protein product [Boreogadus saida]